MKYIEYQPSPLLAKHIKCFWTLEQSQVPARDTYEPIVPDGSLEIVFNLSDIFRRCHRDGTIENQPITIVIGQMRGCVMIEPAGRIRLFGCRFQPAGAHPFFRFPLFALTNRIEGLDLIWGREGGRLEERVNEARTTRERIAIVENVLLDILVAGKSSDREIEAVTKIIFENKGLVSIGTIMKNVGISSSRLEREFRRKLGISPKFFSRIIRFQNLIKTLKKEKTPSFLDAALSLGYYDQAHLIHEFKEFSGKSPGVFLDNEYRIAENFFLPD